MEHFSTNQSAKNECGIILGGKFSLYYCNKLVHFKRMHNLLYVNERAHVPSDAFPFLLAGVPRVRTSFVILIDEFGVRVAGKFVQFVVETSLLLPFPAFDVGQLNEKDQKSDDKDVLPV